MVELYYVHSIIYVIEYMESLFFVLEEARFDECTEGDPLMMLGSFIDSEYYRHSFPVVFFVHLQIC